MWDLWWTKWHWDRFFSEFFGSTRQYHYTAVLHTHISSGGWTCPLVEAVQRRSLTPSKSTICKSFTTYVTSYEVLLWSWSFHWLVARLLRTPYMGSLRNKDRTLFSMPVPLHGLTSNACAFTTETCRLPTAPGNAIPLRAVCRPVNNLMRHVGVITSWELICVYRDVLTRKLLIWYAFIVRRWGIFSGTVSSANRMPQRPILSVPGRGQQSWFRGASSVSLQPTCRSLSTTSSSS
jgi:hypothetical protein